MNAMSTNDPVMDSLLAAVRMLNELRPPERQIPLEPATLIMGPGADFDSMDLVNLFLFAEEAMSARGMEAPSLIEMGTQMAERSSSLSLEAMSTQIRFSLDGSTGH